MLGTDYLMPREPLPILVWLRDYPLDPGQRAAVQGGTAARLLGIPPVSL